MNTVKNKALVGCQKLLYVGKGYMGLRKTAIWQDGLKTNCQWVHARTIRNGPTVVVSLLGITIMLPWFKVCFKFSKFICSFNIYSLI